MQDLGRPGWTRHGAPVGGAADGVSLEVGNRLVGNEAGAAGIEMTGRGGEFEFEAGAEVVVVGGDAEIEIAGRERAMGEVVVVRSGERMRVGRVTRGVRVYVCVRGAIEVKRVMGSASTLASARMGGHEGRALRAGDELEVGERWGERGGEELLAEVERVVGAGVVLAVEGAHAARFSAGAREAFWGGAFVTHAQSDRMGVRLSAVGASVESVAGGRLESEGMMWGAVQVPEGGAPIVLGPDGPTTGGYPVIACVAAVDLAVVGQLGPGAKVRFERAAVEEARMLYRARAGRMRG